MKIVSREEFLAMPSGILFIEMWNHDDDNIENGFRPRIKLDTIYHDKKAIDFFYKELIGGSEQRDGGFDDKPFAIFEEQDILAINNRLLCCLKPTTELFHGDSNA